MWPIQSLIIPPINPRGSGFAVVDVPESVRAALDDFLDRGMWSETRFRGDALSVDDAIIYGPTSRLLTNGSLGYYIAEQMRPQLEAFCECTLQASAMAYGVRVYHRGAYMIDHVDRSNKFVVSATINVRHAIKDEWSGGWPLTLRAPFRREAVELRHRPGQAVLYEGARLWHARPQPLADDAYYAFFVGMTPVSWPEEHGWLVRTFVALRSVRFDRIARLLAG